MQYESEDIHILTIYKSLCVLDEARQTGSDLGLTT